MSTDTRNLSIYISCVLGIDSFSTLRELGDKCPAATHFKLSFVFICRGMVRYIYSGMLHD